MTAASSAEPIPLSLIARMIKYVVLKRKAKFNFERESPAAGNVSLLLLCFPKNYLIFYLGSRARKEI